MIRFLYECFKVIEFIIIIALALFIINRFFPSFAEHITNFFDDIKFYAKSFLTYINLWLDKIKSVKI